MATRCKMTCTEKLETPYGIKVLLRPNYPEDPEHENRVFWENTPSGLLTLSISNKPAASIFVVGDEYYIDISKAE